jgi:hypothetical protein
MSNRNLTVLMATLICLLAVGNLPAIMLPVTPSELMVRSDLVVSGAVVSTNSHWDATKTLIYTDVVIATERFDKGSAGSQVTVRVPGGEVGDVGLAVEDMPVFVTGQRITVYLVKATDGVTYELAAGYQGVIAGGGTVYYSYSGYHRSPASISYYINSSLPSGWSAAIQAGGATWNAAGSPFRFNYVGTTTRTGPTADGYNIVWQKDLGAGGTIAANYYWFDRKTKIISENDLIFNSRLAWSTNGGSGTYDVQNIGTHELGHCLCLDDIYKSYQSEMTMYGYGATGETKKRTLESGDITGIKYIYGTGLNHEPNTKSTTE